MKTFISFAFALFASCMANAEPSSAPDTSPHQVRFVDVEPRVRLEVLDWGGVGQPLVFLTGINATAHTFDEFAPKLTAHHHVYGLTRRGYGLSSKPDPTPENYSADRLGTDVLAAIAALKLDRPVLVGHSIAGGELSFIGSRYPEKVRGLIYLDAIGYGAFYDPVDGEPASAYGPVSGTEPTVPYENAILAGQQKFTHINGPILVISALPHDSDKDPTPERKAQTAKRIERGTRRLAGFQAAMPNARIVRLPYASHFVYLSNEADVLREMNAFMDSLQ